ncbi:MAG: thioredoxin-dependent thiol peroxidase [Candidatus Heimdallarchaeum endolithica]|uniref:thioredoxin-dependent peroxiredoxin n=1 Tax=Candidatus Heimdallarchaeum endolithica TaxID=2876572 RepID=A0A9Y1BRI8_9ARCH|nr:MAG: thioredoxin-dependent thiol peroxidase [Candidatus Heimdallarchaeum endolithica]
MTNLKIGDKAIDFCLKDQNGKEHCLKDYLGKWVVVYFYPRANTPGCTIEAKTFSENIEEFKKKEAIIFGISDDPISKLKKFEEKKNLKVILLSDETHKIINAYGCWIKKRIGPKEYFGTARKTFLISPEGKIAEIWEKVKVKEHSIDVLSTILSKNGD